MIAIIWTRLAAAASLLVILTIMYAGLGAQAFSIVVSVALILVVGVQSAAFVFFGRHAKKHPEIMALRIRVQDAFTLLLGSAAVGVMVTVVILRALDLIPVLDRGVFLVGLSFGLLMLAAPAVNWLFVWKPWRPD